MIDDRAERVGTAGDRRHLEVADLAEHAGCLGDRRDRGIDHAVAAAARFDLAVAVPSTTTCAVGLAAVPPCSSSS